jgi:hypothetical protein
MSKVKRIMFEFCLLRWAYLTRTIRESAMARNPAFDRRSGQ